MRISQNIVAGVAVIAGAVTGTLVTADKANAAVTRIERARYVHCEYDEAIERPRPCVWDGRHMGNGQGRSLLIRRDGTAHVIRHSRAHRIMTREVTYVERLGTGGTTAYVEAANGATFRVSGCTDVPEVGMRMRLVRRMCG